MIGILDLLLRLTIWFLLTSDWSLENILLGVCVALVLPSTKSIPIAWKDWFQMFWKIVVAVPVAYYEAIEMLFNPHVHEEIIIEHGPRRQSPGLIFLDIFLITFTPKTIVVKYYEDGTCEVHRVKARRKLP